MAIARWRIYGAGAALSLVSASNVASAATHAHGIGAHSIAFAGIVGVGAFLFGRTSILAQLIARGIAWSLVVPAAAVATISWTHGFSPPIRLFVAPVLALLALGLARPALDSKKALNAFAPVAFRRVLMAATTASFAIGIAFGEMASTFLAFRLVDVGVVLGVLSALLFGAGIGVARMRAWAMLLAIATAALAVGAVVSFGNAFVGPPLLIAALPGVLMAAVIALGRAGFGQSSDGAREAAALTRVSDLPRTRVEIGADDAREGRLQREIALPHEVDESAFAVDIAPEVRASLVVQHEPAHRSSTA